MSIQVVALGVGAMVSAAALGRQRRNLALGTREEQYGVCKWSEMKKEVRNIKGSFANAISYYLK